jgi:hypothetical protein
MDQLHLKDAAHQELQFLYTEQDQIVKGLLTERGWPYTIPHTLSVKCETSSLTSIAIPCDKYDMELFHASTVVRLGDRKKPNF